MDFYTGQVLRLDLTSLKATIEPLDAEWARLYVGGKGLLLRYLYEELPAGTDALAAENPLILATGPFAGTAVATCSRLAVGCKSPATGTLLDSYVGGSFAPELKFAGYDVVVITGVAAEPVLVLIEDEHVEFLPATGRFGASRRRRSSNSCAMRWGRGTRCSPPVPPASAWCRTPASPPTSTTRPAAGAPAP